MGDNNGKFARRDTVDSMNLFYDVMLCDRTIRTEEEKKEIEASYFAMCLLLPKETFLQSVNILGGFDECYKMEKITLLSNIYGVEKRLIRVRLKDLKSRVSEEENLKNKEEETIKYSDSKINEEKRSFIKRIFNK